MTTQEIRLIRLRYLVRNAVLSNGQPAWPVAEKNGISRTAFKQRLHRGVSPDEAATVPMVERVGHDAPKPIGTVRRQADYTTSDGQPAVKVALASGVKRVTFYARLHRGWSPDQAAGLAPPLRLSGRQRKSTD